MGAWGSGIFENDAALDLALDLHNQGGDYIDKLIAMVAAFPEQGYLESDEACMALAATEYVAASMGKPMAELPGRVKDWISENNYQPADSTLLLSIKAINRILQNSELRDLWYEENEESAVDWVHSVEDIKERISLLI